MTSWHGNVFRINGPLCEVSVANLNKLSKQPRCRWLRRRDPPCDDTVLRSLPNVEINAHFEGARWTLTCPYRYLINQKENTAVRFLYFWHKYGPLVEKLICELVHVTISTVQNKILLLVGIVYIFLGKHCYFHVQFIIHTRTIWRLGDVSKRGKTDRCQSDTYVFYFLQGIQGVWKWNVMNSRWSIACISVDSPFERKQ